MSCVLVFVYNKKVFVLFTLLLLILTSFVWCYLFVEFLFGSFVWKFCFEALIGSFVWKFWTEALFWSLCWKFCLEVLSGSSELKLCFESFIGSFKYMIFILLLGSFGWKLCLKVLNWSFAWKFWLEALNNYVIFILLFGEYLIETFLVLKYVVWYFYMWYTELVCLFEYWVCILCLLYFTELVVDIVDFVFLLYWWFLYAWVSCALLLGNAEGNIENVYGNFFFELICYSRYFYCVFLCYTNFILCYWQNQCVFVV